MNAIIDTLAKASNIVSNVNVIDLKINPGNLNRARMALNELLSRMGIWIDDEGEVIRTELPDVPEDYVDPLTFEVEESGSFDNIDPEAEDAHYSCARTLYYFQRTFVHAESTDCRYELDFRIMRDRRTNESGYHDWEILVTITNCNCWDCYWTSRGTGLYRLLGQNVEFRILEVALDDPISINYK